jgi:putative Mg2+ transporter-C (MgtC) family protein
MRGYHQHARIFCKYGYSYGLSSLAWRAAVGNSQTSSEVVGRALFFDQSKAAIHTALQNQQLSEEACRVILLESCTGDHAMLQFWTEVFASPEDGFWLHAGRVLIRLTIAVLLGAVIGTERYREGKSAGLRTQMLVALGAALFTLVPQEAKVSPADISRVIQGVAAGIGFLGAGTILKLEGEHRIEGLTSAASIWVTAAVGMAVGVGWIWPAVVGVVWGWTILSIFHRFEPRKIHDQKTP